MQFSPRWAPKWALLRQYSPLLTEMDNKAHGLGDSGIKLEDVYATIMANYNSGGIDERVARAEDSEEQKTKKGR